jgi:hypothetical protein
MSKKNKSNPISPSDQAEQARQYESAGNYKDAIDLYKNLYAMDSDEQWRDCLAHCYLERAKQFASRHMPKEALAIWDNYLKFSSDPSPYLDHYILWQLGLNQMQAVKNTLQELNAEQLDNQFTELSVILGFLMLTGSTDLLESLPAESRLCQHWQIVDQALKSEDIYSLNEQLKSLPFKSPFRDFRVLVSASTKLTTDPDQSQQLLSKISSDSVYAPVVQLIDIIALQGAQFAHSLVQLSSATRKLLANTCGLSPEQTKLIDALVKEPKKSKDKFFFNLALQFKNLIGIEKTRIFCQNLLAVYPAGKKEFQKHFDSVSSFETNRVKALQLEEKRRYVQADQHWKLCIESLQKHLQEDEHHGFRIALIYQHMAAYQPAQEDQLYLLKKSLEFNPLNKDLYIKILKLIDELEGESGDYKDWLAKTESAFPDDIDILTLLMQRAFASGANKKAVQYANKLLKKDPLNILAKKIILDGHLNHARKSLKSKKYTIAVKEIEQAKKINPNKTQMQSIDLIDNLIQFANGDKQTALEQIPVILSECYSDPVNQHYRLAAEALQCGLPVATLLRPLPDANKAVISESQLTELFQYIDSLCHSESDIEWINKALERIKRPLKASLKNLYKNEALLLRACETFIKINQYPLIKYCIDCYHETETFLSPLFGYYMVYADTKGNPENCSNMDLMRLDTFLREANQAKDHKTASLIMSYMDEYDEFIYGSPASPFDGINQISNLLNITERLFSDIPEKTMDRILAEVNRLVSRYTEDQLMDQLAIDYKNQPQIIVAILANPEIFGLLMIIKAAANLNIKIGVTAEEVVKSFSQESESSFPFPFPF